MAGPLTGIQVTLILGSTTPIHPYTILRANKTKLRVKFYRIFVCLLQFSVVVKYIT